MSAAPLGRIATGTHLDLLQSGLRRLQDELARKEIEISTGRKINRPSDSPLAAVRTLGYEARAAKAEQYLRNISLQRGELSAAESALGALGRLAARAKEILLGQINGTADAQTRELASHEVQALLDEAMSLANRQFGGRYLFGGTDASKPPMELLGDSPAFRRGAAGRAFVRIEDGAAFGRSVDAAEAFGALSTEIRGRADLDPRLTLETKLADLNGGFGVRLASIIVRDGLAQAATVDLRGAETLGDVVDRINASGVVTATLSAAGSALTLSTAGGGLSVEDVEGGNAARDLGILSTTGAGAVLTGGELDPRVTLTTRLSDLRGGSGIDGAGFTVRNGPVSLAIDVAGLETVEDLLNSLNRPELYLAASISTDGKSLELRSTLSGAELHVEEGAGSSASELGLVIPFAELDVDRLNRGLGVGQGAGNDLRLTDQAGASFEVDLAGAVTLQDLLDRINGAAGNPGTIRVEVVSGQNRLRVIDTSGGAGELVVESVDGSYSAENLGIAGRASGAAAEIVGGDLEPSGVQTDSVFNVLVNLRDALLGNDESRMSLLLPKIDAASQRLLDARAAAGARVQRLDTTAERLEEEIVELEALFNEERGVDLAEAVTEFQAKQTILQASYAVTARILSISLLDFLR